MTHKTEAFQNVEQADQPEVPTIPEISNQTEETTSKKSKTRTDGNVEKPKQKSRKIFGVLFSWFRFLSFPWFHFKVLFVLCV